MRPINYLISLKHLYKIFGIKFIWIWIIIRSKKYPRIFLPSSGNYLRIRSGTSDEWLFYQIFSQKQYQIKVNNCETIIDLGANIGFASVYFKTIYPNARIICVEPDEENFNYLHENMSNYYKSTCYKCAIGSEEGNARIINKSKVEPWAIRTESVSDGNISVFTLDRIMLEQGITQVDILKIDIEGAESELFSKNFDKWLSKVWVIVIELHEHLSPGCGQKFFMALLAVWKDFSVSVKGANIVVKRK